MKTISIVFTIIFAALFLVLFLVVLQNQNDVRYAYEVEYVIIDDCGAESEIKTGRFNCKKETSPKYLAASISIATRINYENIKIINYEKIQNTGIGNVRNND